MPIMGRGRSIRVPALIVSALWLAPLVAEAEYRFEDGVYLGPATTLTDWADTLTRAHDQRISLDACLDEYDACPARLKGMHLLVSKARALSRERQLRLVNRYVNKRRYRGDRSAEVDSQVAGEPVRLKSRWSTLTEFLQRGGDCEDYATSKYQLMRVLGMAAEDLRVVVVYDRQSRGYHAVLAARLEDGAAWLLDSDDSIHRGHPFGYRFVYALNENAIWDHESDAGLWSVIVQAEETS